MEDPNMTDEEIQLEDDVSDTRDCIEKAQEMESNLLYNNELVKAPQLGQLFNSLNELFECYKQYGKQEGFGIRKDTSCFLQDRQTKLVTLVCSRAGKPRSVKKNRFKPNPATKTECKARVNANVSINKCRVTSVVLEHNHGLSPRKSRFYLCNRNISTSAKRRLELSDRAGIRMSKNFNYFVVEAGGHENVPFLMKDGRNYIEKARRLRLGVGDAEATLGYFDKMQDRNSHFYHLVKVDEENRIKHVFWADARSRAAYEEFGDVVTFNTTYLTNKYDMPFAIFVGVNHHGQSTLLGCALISNEDTETFVWLFKAWLSYMSGRAPDAIIIDQDKAMKKAIQIVFPTTRHRWCLWHILKKLPEKFSGHSMYKQLQGAFENVVYDSLTIEECEENWGRFIIQFNLESNKWLSGLYEERHRWVPAFVKDTFWAGMSTTQRSESMNAFFDKYVNSKATVKQFVEQYDNALRSKVENENQADYHSFSSCLPFITHFEIEKRFQEVYTNAKFDEFQVQITGKLYFEVSFFKEENGLWEYDVSEDILIGKRRKVNFKVYFNEENSEVQCACRLFEFRGILCKHAILVFIKKDVIYAPVKYILPRWRKDLRRRHTRVKVGYDDWSGNSEAQRYGGLHKHFDKVLDLAVISDKMCKMLHDCLDSFEEKAKKIGTDCGSSLPTSNSEIVVTSCDNIWEPCVVAEESIKILDPLSARRKLGQPPTNRKVSTVEKFVDKARKKNNQKKGKQVKASSTLEEASIFPRTQECLNIVGNTQAYNQQSEDISFEHSGQFATTFQLLGQSAVFQQIGAGHNQHLTVHSFSPPLAGPFVSSQGNLN